MSELKPNSKAHAQGPIRLWRIGIVEHGLTLAMVLLVAMIGVVALQRGVTAQFMFRSSLILTAVGLAKLWKSVPTQLRACGMIGGYWIAIAILTLERGYTIPNP